MKTNKIAFILAIIAGLLCVINFIYKVITFNELDYMILAAGILILGFGILTSVNANRKKNSQV